MPRKLPLAVSESSHSAVPAFTVAAVKPLATMNPVRLIASHTMLVMVIQGRHRPENAIMKLSR